MKTITLLLTSLVLFTSCTKDPLPTEERLYNWRYYTNFYIWTNNPDGEWPNPSGPFNGGDTWLYKSNGLKRIDTIYNLTEKQAYDKFKQDSVKVLVKTRIGVSFGGKEYKEDIYKYCSSYSKLPGQYIK